MKRVLAIGVVGGCAAAGFLLSRPAGEIPMPSAPSAPSQQADSAALGLGFIETRDYRVEIKSGGRYTVRTKDGKVVAKDVTVEGLRATNPRLHQVLKRALVSPERNNDARGFRGMDGGINAPGLPFMSNTRARP